MSKIIFLGSNPSVRSPSNEAFDIATKSRKTVNEWIKIADIKDEIIFLNVIPHSTPNNKALSNKEIRLACPDLKNKIEEISMGNPIKIIALGKTAAKILTLLRLHFYEMPHPSGLNRLLNDSNYMTEKIKGLKEYAAIIKYKREAKLPF